MQGVVSARDERTPSAADCTCFLQKKYLDQLHKYCAEDPRDWDKTLPYIIFAYNTTIHTTTVATPYSLILSAIILLICSNQSPMIKNRHRASLLTGSIGNLGRPILMHGNFWQAIKANRKTNIRTKFSENHTKLKTRFGFSRNIRLNKKKNFFCHVRNHTLSLKDFRKLITKLLFPTGLINAVYSTKKFSIFSWK